MVWALNKCLLNEKKKNPHPHKKQTLYSLYHALLQGIFQRQGSNPGFLHFRRILYCLSRQKSPKILECIAYPFSRGTSWPRNPTRVSSFAGRFFTSWATRVQRLISIEAIEKKIPGVCPERKEFSGTHNSCFYLRKGAAGWTELEGKSGTSVTHLWARHFPGALFT